MMRKHVTGLVRLINGTTIYEGRVEVYYAGEWGTVCDDGWRRNAAQVVCSELGFGSAISVRYNAYYGEGNGQIWLDDVICVGNESTIGSCLHSGWGVHNCDHDDDVGIKCSPSGMYYNFYIIKRLHCRSHGCIIGASLSEPHHVGSTVKFVFLLACLILYGIYG